MLKRKIFAWILLILATGSVQAQAPGKEQYINGLTTALNTVNSTYNRPPDQALLFSGNLFLAHGGVVAAFTIENLKAYVDGLKAAGVNRIDINPRLGHWLDTASPQNAPVVAKYDALIAYIRGYGLQVALNPAYSAGDPTFQSFEAWQTAAGQAYRELARRYKPDIFVVVHEPTTMASRMQIQTTPQQWKVFAQTLARVVKQESPGSRIGAGGLFTEEEYFREFVTIPELDVATVDIYNLANLADYTRMVNFAQQNGKPTYIEETWRPAQQSPGASIGDSDYAALDVKWLQTITLYARSVGMEAVTPFWTQGFFAYTPNNENGMSASYNMAVAQAVGQGQQTATFQAFQQITQQWGKKIPVSVSGASFRGPLTPDSIASAFAPNLTTATAVASSRPLPTTLGGVSMKIKDAAGVERQAPLFFVTPGQVNYLVPPGLAPGVATVTVTTSSGAVVAGNAFVESVVPSVFTANASGQGVAAAVVVRGRADGSQGVELIFQCGSAPGSCTPTPVDLGPESDQVFLLLFGTGIRGGSGASVQIGGQDVPVVYAGAHQDFLGLDQLNVRLTRNLIGRGQVDIVVTVGGRSSLPVTIQIK